MLSYFKKGRFLFCQHELSSVELSFMQNDREITILRYNTTFFCLKKMFQKNLLSSLWFKLQSRVKYIVYAKCQLTVRTKANMRM